MGHSSFALASADSCEIKHCTCGCVHLALGPTVVNIETQAFLGMVEKLQKHAAQLRTQQSKRAQKRNRSIRLVENDEEFFL